MFNYKQEGGDNMIFEMFNEQLIDLNTKCSDENELFNLIGERLIKKGLAKPNYISGLKKRENEYPTGLIFPKISIALPHVDSVYIKTPFIYIVRNESEISVRQMGDSQQMKTRYFWFLGIKDAKKQPDLLAKLMDLFQNANFVEKFVGVSDSHGMYNMLINILDIHQH